MSSKKDKYLASAQKFISKGQLDKAIKDYEQIIALDPNDIRHRQRLAELLVRCNRTVDAIGEYEAIGKYYADNGFYLKAIAVYKQIQKLDPTDMKTCLNLAVLNEKQGLTGNALAEYGKVYSNFEKTGKLAEALKILESMIDIDPDNLNTRLKMAETRHAQGMKNEAFEEFTQIALLLKKRGDENAFRQICDRIKFLFSDKPDISLNLLAALIKSGDVASAVRDLNVMVGSDPSNLSAWDLLLHALQESGAREDARQALQKMARIFPDDLSVREKQLQGALDDRDIDGGVYLLGLHGAKFMDKGAAETLERIYLKFIALAPHDIRLLGGVKALYESVGNRQKAAEIEERIDSLSRLGVGTAEAAPAVTGSPSEGMSLQSETVDTAGSEALVEIPLNLSEEMAVGEGGIGGAAEHADAGLEPSERETDAIQHAEADLDEMEQFGEIDLDLSFCEDELAGDGDFCREEEPETESTSDEERMSEGTLPEERGKVFEFPREEPALEEEVTFVDLDIDILPPVEGEAAVAAEAEVGGTDGVPDKYSPDRLSSAFKKGLAEQLDSGDFETRYNLGIAFKEMGLYDEAIAEFAAASSDPGRLFDCIVLQGICHRDKGDYLEAEEMFAKGVALAGLSPEDVLSVKYELALVFESSGRNDDALELYRRIHGERKDFRDTTERIARLQGSDEIYDADLVELEGEEIE